MPKHFLQAGRTTTNLTVILTILAIHSGVWWFFNRPITQQQDWQDSIQGVSFSPYQSWQDPFLGIHPSAQELRDDLRLLQGRVREVRSYGSTNGLEQIPALAAEFGLFVTAGAWLDADRTNNAQELHNLLRNAEVHANVKQVILGNESLLRGDLTVAELSRYLREARDRTTKPVSTAEPWHVWMDHPELAAEVDFIAIHILPYWEDIPADTAVQWALDRHADVANAFPGKRILVAEVGWPSHGERNGPAKPGRDKQAIFLREFLPAAQKLGIEYFVMEAFDQPWKQPMEGVVGGHWGIFDQHRQPKFAWTGPIVRSVTWGLECAAASLLGVLMLGVYLRRRSSVPVMVILPFGLLLQAAAATMIWYAGAPMGAAYSRLELAVWLGLFPLNLGLLTVVLTSGLEMERLLSPGGLRRDPSASGPQPVGLPKVSLHVAICNEPADMVLKTLSSLDALDYPDFEVLVVDNNTTSSASWHPVQEFCKGRGTRFRFFHLRKCKGFKAGALNFALTKTHPDTGIVGIVDSDYVVRPDWLRTLAPNFCRDPQLALVQAPQDHRDWETNSFKTMCNWEYAGFFQIGMVHRNEDNAIIQHGTMSLIRHEALREAGGWATWCICEDAELGLRLMAAGHKTLYVPQSFGWGLAPDTFSSYCGQRFRWAYGAVQILKRHWRCLLPWNRNNGLTPAQKYHFLTGWLPWFADAAHLLCVTASLLWAGGMLLTPNWIGTPMSIFLLPVMAAFGFRLLQFIWLYQVRVRCGLPRTLGAALAGTALMHTIGKAVLSGMATSDKPFLRTPKSEAASGLFRGLSMVRQEALLGLLLWLAAGWLALDRGFADGDVNLWMAVLVLQSSPYVAAVAVALVNVLSIKPAGDLPRTAAPAPSVSLLRLRFRSAARLTTSLLLKGKI
ncbi:glycosyltransferase [Desulfonatronum thiodismutans]|uniref:glycosyltransferase n=1 Tax=Desulfonatronum thiodismutans TaxID=159290 RepID=UPI00068A875D|nr:glycosyltransferase [Desulfonatronum thiodismutans]